MRHIRNMITKSLAWPFYRQNAAQFTFIFILFFGAVGEIGGRREYTGPIPQLHYQYALIMGMLRSPTLFGFVFLAWLIYAEKCVAYTLATLRKPEYSFLDVLNRLSSGRMFRTMLWLQALLFLPVILYSFAIMSIAYYHHWYVFLFIIPLYILLLCLISAGLYHFQLRNPGKRSVILLPGLLPTALYNSKYWGFLIRFAIREKKLLLLGLKIYTCGVLVVSVNRETAYGHDLRMPLLLFNLGILGHSVLIYHFRSLEDQRLSFYRGLPVSRFNRFFQHGITYLLILIPEIITVCWLTPGLLQLSDMPLFILSAYSLLLLMNSLLFVTNYTMKDFLKLSLLIFGILYFAVLSGCLLVLSGIILIAAFALFYLGYYNYSN